ncbi:TerB family tellurite resistance protein [Paragemmobacter straminiformis]|uniref:TerB family tellurite resistance protein n=1 Tax=Paragemmobacter straminiformis TaxID=2045119 RepID=A0A842I2T9_9RHOB|nr:TerB family tellurite resistance protein [Gemmobacter straminiformis]MBC2834086.1 TerB family tellurite resistance protein [Gemmobacter straminiformis]
MASAIPDETRRFEGVDRVVAEPLKFKAKLGIGEDAFASLQTARMVGDLWQIGTAATAGGLAASSSAVAGTFFGGGWLAALGIGAAVTPVGWVVGAAVASGAACYGVLRLFRSYEGTRVQKVPAFINTPIDVLGAALFDLMASLAIRVAREAEEVDDAERAAIADYFVAEWGLDPAYVAAALPVIEHSAEGRSVDEIAEALAVYKRDNPDCNFDSLKVELLSFLTEIAAADGILHDAELAAIARTDRIFQKAAGGWTETARSALDYVAAAPSYLWSTVTDGVAALWGSDGQTADAPSPSDRSVPVLWLLGKTGAGKSSLVQAMTGRNAAEIGNGFVPCTRTADAYDFPPEDPVLRFLDTRGLGEAGYRPEQDLASNGDVSQMILVLSRLDDPVQGNVADALAKVVRKKPDIPVVILHTAEDRVPDAAERGRIRSANQTLFEKAAKTTLPWLELDLSSPSKANLSHLKQALATTLPSVAMLMDRQKAGNAEEAAFLAHRATVLRYAGMATASGALPVVGAATAPALQLALVTALANGYGLPWDRSRLVAFLSALGTGVVGGALIGIAGRSLAGLIPVVGQTAVPVLTAGYGFASTYGVGRAAAYWMYHTKAGHTVDEQALRDRYLAAFSQAEIKDGDDAAG